MDELKLARIRLVADWLNGGPAPDDIGPHDATNQSFRNGVAAVNLQWAVEIIDELKQGVSP